MKNGDIHINVNDLPSKLKGLQQRFKPYRVFTFFLIVASLYGYIVWRINVYSNAPPSQSEEQVQTTAQPHIDAATIDKIQSLQDNSVNVQAIFEQARENPFSE